MALPTCGMTKDEFEKRIEACVDGGWVTLGLALGSATGLIDVMCELNTWATSEKIADASNCKERYVREWLYHMTSCGVIDMKKNPEVFFLDQNYRPTVQSAKVKSSKYLTGLACSFPMLAEVFKKNGPNGLDPETAGTWLAFWENERDFSSFFAELRLPKELQKQLKDGLCWCDLGGGRGNLALSVAKTYPNVNLTCCDMSEEALAEGKRNAQSLSLTTIDFVKADVNNLPSEWANKFDYITMCEVFHNLPYPSHVAEAVFKILRPGGFLSLFEPRADSDPYNTVRNIGNGQPGHILFAFSLYYCLSTSLSFTGSAGLGSAAGQQQLGKLVESAGFVKLHFQDVEDFSHMLFSKPV